MKSPIYALSRKNLIPRKNETGSDYEDRLADFIGDLTDSEYSDFEKAFEDHCLAMAAGYTAIKLVTRCLRISQ